RHWRFKNRETGHVLTFGDSLWPGQQRLAAAMGEYPWLFALKAGKLGFTELECAYDGWQVRFARANGRIHLFSKDAQASKQLLDYVRFGLTHLPGWMMIAPLAAERGGDTGHSLKLRIGEDDLRTVMSYASENFGGVDATASHTHMDELWIMPHPETAWAAASGSVSPSGSMHVVSRGAGDTNFTATLYRQAETAGSLLVPYFAPWHKRPRVPVRKIEPGEDSKAAWYAEMEPTMPGQNMRYFAPASADEALAGSGEDSFVAIEAWDACLDPELPPMVINGVVDQTPLVIGVDAGISSDYFAVVAISRHPDRHDEVAIRAIKLWKPPVKGQIDLSVAEDWLRVICLGGCLMGHPNKSVLEKAAVPGCVACEAGDYIERHKVVQITYDAYQLTLMMQRLQRDRVAWCDEFSQAGDRLKADGALRKLIITRQISYGPSGTEEMREHIKNARARIDPNEDTKLRIVKRHPKAKVDLVVAASMAAARCLYLNI
ncbi:hypothetical protein LCGC14_1929230, partial [marine sediment metagenome]